MLFNKTLIASSLLVLIFLAACGGSEEVTPRKPKPLDTTGKSPTFIKGAEDGCDTAKGDYTKNHEAFNNDIDYHEGWFTGRGYCQL